MPDNTDGLFWQNPFYSNQANAVSGVGALDLRELQIFVNGHRALSTTTSSSLTLNTNAYDTTFTGTYTVSQMTAIMMHASNIIAQWSGELAPEQRQAALAERVAASARAERLLRESLSPQQLEQFTLNGWFEVQAPEGRLYRVRRGRVANVECISRIGERVLERLCCHPAAECPDEDTMLAQKLWLENDEPAFRALANFHRV